MPELTGFGAFLLRLARLVFFNSGLLEEATAGGE